MSKLIFIIFLSVWLGNKRAEAKCLARNYTDVLNINRSIHPHIFIVILVRNKEASLPYFLTHFQRLNYPTIRMTLYIRADHCEDRSIDILEHWLSEHQHLYRSIDAKMERVPKAYGIVGQPHEVTDEIMNRVVRLKTEALNRASTGNFDYVMFLDADVYFTNKNVLLNLVFENYSIIAPMLESLHSHSNFWGAMTSDFWYERSSNYEVVLKRNQLGCFQVPLVHSCVLINLKSVNIEQLTFNSTTLDIADLPFDDTISFAISLLKADIPSYVCNTQVYGYVDYPAIFGDSLNVSYEHIRDVKLAVARYHEPLQVSSSLLKYLPTSILDTAGLSRIYYINLSRRRDRRRRMEYVLRTAGLKGHREDAVDSRKLTDTFLRELGINVMHGYIDPIKERRGLTMGEIACFLSHYKIWQDVVDKNYDKVLILEDDAHLGPAFRDRLQKTLISAKTAELEWDLIYVGRKKMDADAYEPEAPGVAGLVEASYSYWLVGYLLSHSGATKLLRTQPLENMIAADEYVPLMYDKPYTPQWTRAYPIRDVTAYAQVPDTMEPCLYSADRFYVSDTEGIDKTPLPHPNVV